VVAKLVTEFLKVEGHRSKLKRPTTRICDMLLGPPTSRAGLANCLDEAARKIWVELATRQEGEAELEDLQSLAAWVWDLVLDDANGPSSLVVSMSSVAKLLESRIEAEATNEFRWGSCSVLVATMSHFLELDVNLEVLGSGHSAGLTKDEVDAIWS
jgi:hypothetical protein